ncbi:PREDICTED: uncharacterized protein LOC101293949 [Fragaria vesca subsp. vesca]|uniref:uncharacterized protein LOC101293949 n=1 Tax=Fragaria vesca subsp. vesca TaxID=101020 RepID=UPI0002C336CB|nr:PREDICTED: uncharacterized protein LOC101293949 [Fragaria vesca subsp. vesca]
MLPPPVSLHSEAPPLSLLPFRPHSFTNELFLVPAWRGVFKNKDIGMVVRAVKEEEGSQQFEVDPEKAREALRNLDQQFQSRTQKQVRSRPKKEAAPSVNFTRNQTKEAAEKFSGEFFTYTAVALLAFTIFYNVFFYTVVKPSVDGFSEDVPTTSVEREIPN